MTSPVAARYRDFAEREAHGVSAIYEDWALGVCQDEVVIGLLGALPRERTQPNLVFAAARHRGAPDGAYGGFRDWLVRNWDEVRLVVMARNTQTNEAARCATLLPVLSTIDGPLALIEVGASAGLCLYPDRYSYRYETASGVVAIDPPGGESAVRLPCSFTGESPPTRLPTIAWRAGVDLNPLDPGDPGDATWLTALVWPEHDERRTRLGAALRIASAEPAPVVRGDLVETVEELLAQVPSEARAVVVHSAVLAYVDPARRERFAALVRGAGDVVWISNEGEGVLPRVQERLTRPAGGRFVLAVDEVPVAFTGPHGQSYEEL